MLLIEAIEVMQQDNNKRFIKGEKTSYPKVIRLVDGKVVSNDGDSVGLLLESEGWKEFDCMKEYKFNDVLEFINGDFLVELWKGKKKVKEFPRYSKVDAEISQDDIKKGKWFLEAKPTKGGR